MSPLDRHHEREEERKMTYNRKIPIRLDKVEKHRKYIARLENDKKRKLRPGERLAVIYDQNFKENNTEQEEEEKGFSLKELYLILYDVGDVIKTISYYGDTDEYDEQIEVVDKKQRERLIALQYSNEWEPFLKKTRRVMKYFDKSSYKKRMKARDKNEVQHFNINWMRTRKGAYYYYNMINEEDLEQSKRHDAKCCLGIEKLQRKLLDIAERDEREQEEIKKGRRKKTSSQLHMEEIKKELRAKQDEANRKKMQKKEKELLDKKPHVDVSLNNRIDAFIEEN